LHGHGSLEQSNGDDDLISAVILHENAFEIPKWAFVYSNTIALAQEWPWPGRGTRTNNFLNRLDFMLFNRDGRITATDEMYDTRCYENRQANLCVRLAKEVAVEKRKFDLFDAVRPAPACQIERKEGINPLGLK
jgi:hypothetical protein